MKNLLLAILLLIGVSAALAQDQAPPMRAMLTRNSVIKDTSGNRYSYSYYKFFVMTGNIKVTPVHPDKMDTEFILGLTTGREKLAILAAQPKPIESTYFKTGKSIEPFSTKDINGLKIPAEAWHGKTVVINFWFIACPPCVAEIPALNGLVDIYKDDPDILFLAIALDDKEALLKFTQQTPFNYHVIPDGSFITNSFFLFSFPTNVIINRSGNVSFHYMGYEPAGIYWLNKMIQASTEMKI